MLSERLAGVDVGQVHFHERQIHRHQGIAQGDAGVGVGTRVDDDGVHCLDRRLLDAVHQGAFVVGLEAGQAVTKDHRLAGQRRLDGGEALVAVNPRLPVAEQVEIGTVDQQQVAQGSVTRFTKMA